jgi:hypothetical protein
MTTRTTKLDAWLGRFSRSGVAPEASAALANFTHAWNGYGHAPDWAALQAQLPALTAAWTAGSGSCSTWEIWLRISWPSAKIG